MNISGISGQKILYGCLDWGNGHVFRSIPIIGRLLHQKNEVLIFCSRRQEQLFRHYLKDKVSYHIGFEQDFHFSGSGNFAREMWLNRAHFFRDRRNETLQAGELVKALNIDLIISDHRYGLMSDHVHSIFLTHQLHLPAGIVANLLHGNRMSKFTSILILDDAKCALAGKLSRGGKTEQYVGWFSRFEENEKPVDEESIVAVLSGPDIYAGQLLSKIGELKSRYPGNWKIISTNPGLATSSPEIVSDLSEADELIAAAGKIVSRSGYTTLMDLEFLQKPAILIPTKGQTEQEYLAALQEGRADRTIIRI